MIRLRHLTACFASAATPHGSLARAATTTATTSFSFSTSAGTMAAAAAAAVAAAPSQGELKKQVGYKAVDDFVRSGMKIGLGTGSTAYFAVERVGQLLASGELTDIIAVRPCLRRFCLPGPALPFSARWTR
jgi:ribose 5-phosphate isomerase A